MAYRFRTTGREIHNPHRGTVDGLARSAAEEDRLNLLAARAFAQGPGREFLEHLLDTYFSRVLPPAVASEELHHLEGQRWLLSVIARRLELGQLRGPQGHALSFADPDPAA